MKPSRTTITCSVSLLFFLFAFRPFCFVLLLCSLCPAVMFYAPWCGHCKSFKPHFAAAATKAAGKYVLAKVDCTQDSAKGLCQQQEVRGYPTVKFFKHGSAQEYTGPRDTEGVLGWLEKKTGPAALTLASAEEVKTFVADHGESTIVTGYFDKEDSEAHKEFIEAANDADMEEFKFVQAFGTDQKDGSITLHFKGQAQTRPDGENIARWAFENSFPLVDEVGGHNFARYAKLGKPLHLVFVEPTDEGKDALVANLETVAAEHKDESFSWIDANEYALWEVGPLMQGHANPHCIFSARTCMHGIVAVVAFCMGLANFKVPVQNRLFLRKGIHLQK